MKSKFALSFGVSLIFVGILNIFWETNSIILLGMSISSLLFSIINIFFTILELFSKFKAEDDSKLEFIYIIPFIILISIFCYSDSLKKYDLINDIVNSNLVNMLTFISFGILFVGEFINHIKENIQEKYRFLMVIRESINNIASILNIIEKYNNIDGKTAEEILKEINELCKEKIEINNIELSILEINKDKYSLNDIEKILIKDNDKHVK